MKSRKFVRATIQAVEVEGTGAVVAREPASDAFMNVLSLLDRICDMFLNMRHPPPEGYEPGGLGF